ncbi:MAG: class I SAM-dependent RNA methyltransferase [Actinobacteria bacterium]|nr:MAG: class I SAM-dependent RNA methyltransferase [Actinomycetota bacterium]
MRCGLATGDRIVVIAGRVPDRAPSWGAAAAQAARGAVRPVVGDPWFTEEVAGATLRVSALAFFQVNTAGAGALVDLVAEALTPGSDDTLLDGYSGGGLFAATVGAAVRRVICVESGADAVADARHNLRRLLPGRHRVVRGRFERVAPELDEPWTITVVDPPRAGLGKPGVAAAIATEPRAIAYVSCEAASLARDTHILGGAGYALDWVTPVDMFPQTFHIEAVASFSRV